MTPVETLLAVRQHGGSLTVQDGSLVLEADEDFPEAVFDQLTANKPALVSMLVETPAEPPHSASEAPDAAGDEMRFSVEIRWARERGWLRIRDPWGDWHEVLASECPPSWKYEAMDRKRPERGVR